MADDAAVMRTCTADVGSRNAKGLGRLRAWCKSYDERASDRVLAVA